MEKNGEYYLYTTFVKPDENARTYVLKSDRPEGPFLFAGRNSISSHSLDGV